MKAIAAVSLFAALLSAQYAGPKTVYILPMTAGLDQYLAQWLTKDHVMTVVADPKAADVVMTDRLGEGFEEKMKEIRPDLAKPARSDKDDKSDKGDLKSNDTTQHRFTTSRTQGTIFLVDAKTRKVLWSDYQKPPRSHSDSDLNRTAEEIVKKLAGPSVKESSAK